MGLLKERNLVFLIAKNHVSLQMLLNGWFVQDLFFEGGPDLVAIKGHVTARIKIRYATKSDAGYTFSSGGQQNKTFFELAEGSDFFVFVCVGKNRQPTGFYVFPHSKTPKVKAFLHTIGGPFPKYREFYDNWKALEWK